MEIFDCTELDLNVYILVTSRKHTVKFIRMLINIHIIVQVPSLYHVYLSSCVDKSDHTLDQLS